MTFVILLFSLGIHLQFNPNQTSQDTISKAQAGHDTNKYKAESNKDKFLGLGYFFCIVIK